MSPELFRFYDMALASNLKLRTLAPGEGLADWAFDFRDSNHVDEREDGEPIWERELEPRHGGALRQEIRRGPEGLTFHWKGERSVLVRPGDPRSWIIEKDVTVAADDVERLLFTVNLKPLLLAIGRVCLHASVVSRGERAFALVGHCGIGKSTLASLLVALHDYALMADDVMPWRSGEAGVDVFSGPAVSQVYPSFDWPALLAGKAGEWRTDAPFEKLAFLFPHGPRDAL